MVLSERYSIEHNYEVVSGIVFSSLELNNNLIPIPHLNKVLEESLYLKGHFKKGKAKREKRIKSKISE